MKKHVLFGVAFLLASFAVVILWQARAASRERELAVLRTQSERLRHRLLDAVGQDLEGEDLSGATMKRVQLQRPGNAFQRANFSSAELDESVLEAGDSSFQLACFDDSSLTNARLTGGAASFQLASFANANLKGAVLNGSFQAASFHNAVLRESKLIGSFQACDISGASFVAADLTQVDPGSLESCYFTTPPDYSSRTRFPTGFNPNYAGWHKSLE